MKTIIHLPASTNFRVKLGFEDGFPSITKGKLLELEISRVPFFPCPLICKPFGKAFIQETKNMARLSLLLLFPGEKHTG